MRSFCSVSKQTSANEKHLSHIQNRRQHSPSHSRSNRNIILKFTKTYIYFHLLPLGTRTNHEPSKRKIRQRPTPSGHGHKNHSELPQSERPNTTTGYEPKRYRWVLILFLTYSLWNMQGSLSLLNPRIVERLKKTKPLTPNRLYPLPFKMNCVSDSFNSHSFTTASQIGPARRQSATTAAGCGRWVIPSLFD